MKKENTLENKAKFFALYLNQNVLKWHSTAPILTLQPNDLFPHKLSDNHFIELTPLSQITDNDAQWVIRNESVFPDWGWRDTVFKVFLQYKFNNRLKTSTVDYLRSKEYAIDWMGLSVEEMVEYGWVKLKD